MMTATAGVGAQLPAGRAAPASGSAAPKRPPASRPGARMRLPLGAGPPPAGSRQRLTVRVIFPYQWG